MLASVARLIWEQFFCVLFYGKQFSMLDKNEITLSSALCALSAWCERALRSADFSYVRFTDFVQLGFSSSSSFLVQCIRGPRCTGMHSGRVVMIPRRGFLFL